MQCFNDFLEALKKKVEDKNLTDFWEIIIQGVSNVVCNAWLRIEVWKQIGYFVRKIVFLFCRISIL